MADVKWIKITTDLFDNRKIRQIENLPDGDGIIVIWVKMLCLAGNINDNGLLYITKEIPYTEEMLAQQFNRPLLLVKLALDAFVKFNMIEIIDDIFHISNWEKYQNIEGLEKIREQTRARVAKHREKQKQIECKENDVIQCNVTSNATVTQSNATDKEEEKEREEEKNITVSKDTVCQTQVRRVIEAWNCLESFGIKPVSKVTSKSKRYASLMARIKERSLEDVLLAIERIKQSDFLCGRNKKGWVITFDWFVLPNNFPKVLEGNYDNGKPNNGQTREENNNFTVQQSQKQENIQNSALQENEEELVGDDW